MRNYFENNGIVFRKDARKEEWQVARTYAKKTSIGLPASGSTLIQDKKNTASAAQAHLQYLLLDVLKKGRKQFRKAGLPATPGKGKQGAPVVETNNENDKDDEDEYDEYDEDNDDDAGWPKKHRKITRNIIMQIVVWVCIVNAQYAYDTIDRSQLNAYACVICHKSHLVILEEVSMEVVYTAIKSKIPVGRTIHIMYVPIMKPLPSRVTPADLVQLTNDNDLEAFQEVARTEYKPLCIQVQLARGDETAQTLLLDNQPYFLADRFVGPDPTTIYDVPVSDSENKRYLRVLSRGKKKVWPKSDAGFEHQKAMSRKRIRRLKQHLEALKDKLKEFYSDRYISKEYSASMMPDFVRASCAFHWHPQSSSWSKCLLVAPTLPLVALSGPWAP